MKRKLSKFYDGRNSCGLHAMRQLTDRSDSDIMSACINHGYDPVNGGIEPDGFRMAALQLGVKLSPIYMPRHTVLLGDMIKVSKTDQRTLVIGVDNHVLIIDKGEVLDSRFFYLSCERVQLMMFVKN